MSKIYDYQRAAMAMLADPAATATVIDTRRRDPSRCGYCGEHVGKGTCATLAEADQCARRLSL